MRTYVHACMHAQMRNCMPAPVHTLTAGLEDGSGDRVGNSDLVGQTVRWRIVGDPLQDLQLGSEVRHEKRGHGRIVSLNPADERGKPYQIKFDTGDSHQYSTDSVVKLQVMELSTAAADEDRLSFVRQHTLEQGGVSKRIDLVVFGVSGTGRLATGVGQRGNKPWYTS